jgi:tetratricopeptide (TPR) repeat protein
LILEEIGNRFEEQGLFGEAILSLQTCHSVDPQNGAVMQKLGGIYCNDQNETQDKDSAIECFKMAVELVKGDSNKQKIALTLQ